MAAKYLRDAGDLLQYFPLIPGQVNIDAAAGAKQCRHFYCSVAGSFTVTFSEGTIATMVMVVGESFTIPDGATITAVAGAKFHYV